MPTTHIRPQGRRTALGAGTFLAVLVILATLLITVIGTGTAGAETPAERCARETSAYNAAWAASWAASNPGQSPSDAPPPPVPYVCVEPQDPTTTPTSPTTTAPGLPQATDTGTGPQVGAHAPTDIPTMRNTPIVTVPPAKRPADADVVPYDSEECAEGTEEKLVRIGSSFPRAYCVKVVDHGIVDPEKAGIEPGESGACSVFTDGGTCSARYDKTTTITVEGGLSAELKGITASLGGSYATTTTVSKTCESPKLMAGQRWVPYPETRAKTIAYYPKGHSEQLKTDIAYVPTGGISCKAQQV